MRHGCSDVSVFSESWLCEASELRGSVCLCLPEGKYMRDQLTRFSVFTLSIPSVDGFHCESQCPAELRVDSVLPNSEQCSLQMMRMLRASSASERLPRRGLQVRSARDLSAKLYSPVRKLLELCYHKIRRFSIGSHFKVKRCPDSVDVDDQLSAC